MKRYSCRIPNKNATGTDVLMFLYSLSLHTKSSTFYFWLYIIGMRLRCDIRYGNVHVWKLPLIFYIINALQWRHNDHEGVSNHQPRGYLLNRLFRRRSKKTSELRVTGLCARNSPVTGELPAQMASNAEYVSIWWRHHDHINSETTTKEPLYERNALLYTNKDMLSFWRNFVTGCTGGCQKDNFCCSQWRKFN